MKKFLIALMLVGSIALLSSTNQPIADGDIQTYVHPIGGY